MNSSLYRHKLKLLRREISRDPLGGAVESWSEAGTIRGQVQFLRGSELWRAQSLPQRQAQTEARIIIRNRWGLNPADYRVVYGPTTFDIQAIIPDEAHRALQLMVKAAQSQQAPEGQVNV